MRRIQLTQNKVALVSDEDYPLVRRLKWTYLAPQTNKRTSGYAVHYFREGTAVRAVSLHRYILKPKATQQVDHKDGNGLNCQRSNMRICSQAKNALNNAKHHNKRNSKYKGVHPSGGGFPRQIYGYYAQVTVRGVHYKSKTFKTQKEAAEEYDRLAIKHHGEFARLNFPIRKGGRK